MPLNDSVFNVEGFTFKFFAQVGYFAKGKFSNVDGGFDGLQRLLHFPGYT